jgi:hypothetical protein
MENRNGLLADARRTWAATAMPNGLRRCHMISRAPIRRKRSQSVPKAEDFVNDLRSMNAAPHKRPLVGDRRPHHATRRIRRQPSPLPV